MDILNSLNGTLFPGHRVPRVNGWKEGEKYQLPRDCEVIMLDSNPDWAAKFMKMSDMEVEHANCMTKMFASEEKPKDIESSLFSAMQKEIIDIYANSMNKIEGMKTLYWNA